MKPVRIIYTLLFPVFFGILASQQGFAQNIPKLYPGAHRTLTTYDALPTDCFEQMFIDPGGRMWLVPCGDAQRNRELNLIQFDGYEGNLHQLGLETGSTLMLGGVLNDTIVVGCELTYNSIVLYSIHSGNRKVIPIPDSKMSFYGIHLVGDRIFALASGNDRHDILELKDDSLIVLNTFTHFKPSESIYVWGIMKQSVSIDEQIWFTDRRSSVYSYSTDRNQLAVHSVGDSINLESANLSNWDGQLVISLSNNTSHGIVSFDGNRPYSPDILPKGWTYSREYSGYKLLDFVYTDSAGWLFAHCKDQEGKQRDLLINRRGDIIDYTPVTASLQADLYGWLSSHDFTKRAFVYSGVVNLIEISTDFEISRISTPPSRALIELSGDRFLCLTDVEPVVVSTDAGGYQVLSVPQLFPINPSERKTILSDERNRLWFIDQDTIQRFDLESRQSQKYPWSGYIDEFVVVGDRVLFISEQSLHWLNPSTSLIEEVYPKGPTKEVSGFTNEMVVSNDSIWIATSKGLFSFNPKTSLLLYHRIGDLAEIPLLTVFQDATGNPWLGSESSGLIRYNPSTSLSEFCDRKNGLPHNTIVGILSDDAGNIWVNSFDGVAVVNRSLDVIATFNKERGLIENEGNRWSSVKLANGQMVFGSVSGLSVISPRRALQIFNNIPVPRIYVKSISFPNPLDERNTLVLNPNLNEVFKLPSDRRSLEFDLGISAYVQSEKNNYYYKIEQPGYDWTSSGNQQHIVVTNLPSGKYGISVRAKDANGIWTSNTEIIRLNVGTLFYTQWWFFVLCISPFVGFLMLWLWRNSRERLRLEGEVQKRTATITKQTEELRQLDQAKTRIYTNITHEFRTPLTVVRGTSELIEGNDDKKRIIRRNTDRLLNLVNQLLELSKLESGMLELKMVQLDVSRLVRDIFESFTAVAEDKDIGMHFYAHQSEIVMDCDVEVVYRIVGNLLSNAVKFTASGGNIYVDIQKVIFENRESLQLTVRDTGVGIPEDKINKIFKRFYQVDDTTTRAGEGTGIGLALTNELIEFLSGSINVNSNTTKGTTFIVNLPISNNAPADVIHKDQEHSDLLVSAMATNTELTDISSDGSGDMPDILIVEDNPDVIHYLMNCLRGSYRVHAALDGVEGVEKALQLIPDLIISDVMMPGKDGIQLCSEVKADERTSHIPVILLTAKADFESRIEGLERGADAYMAKPFEKTELLLVVRNLILSRHALRQRYLADTPPPVTQDVELTAEDLFMNKLNLLIQEHLDDEDYGVIPLCHAMKYGRSQMHNKVKALTGLSTSAYIQLKRMQHARVLLSGGDMHISEVAYAVGFRDPNYFSRVFRKEFGMTPTEFLNARMDI